MTQTLDDQAVDSHDHDHDGHGHDGHGHEESGEPGFLRPPSACGTEFEQVDWVGTLGVRLDETTLVGVRFSDQALMDVVAECLADRLVATIDEPPAYYSVKLNAPTRRRKTPMHYVYLGTRPVVGTRDVARLLDGLAAMLSAHLEPPTDEYVVYGTPVGTPAGVLLVPSDLVLMSKVVDRVLRPEGYVTADTSRVLLDAGSGQVTIPERSITIDVDAETLAAFPASAPEERLETGRHPLAGWLVSVGADDAGPLRRAKALAYGAGAVRTPYPQGAQAALDEVSRVTGQVPVQGVTWASEEELVQAVLDAGRG